MKLPRRNCLYLAAGAAVLPAASRNAWAQSYPTRPVHLIVGFPPGGTADIVARLVGQSLSERLRQPVIVDNRPGASGNIAAEAAVRATPDGYSLLYVNPANAINAALFSNLNFNFIRDIAPVASIGGIRFVMVVNPSLPAKTIPEFIAYAKANPGKINYASGGIGSPGHVSGALFNMMAGVDLVLRAHSTAISRCGSYALDSGHKRDQSVRPFRADTVAKVESCRATNFSRNYETGSNRRFA